MPAIQSPWKMNLTTIDKSQSKKSLKLSPKGFSVTPVASKKPKSSKDPHTDSDQISKLKIKKAYDVATSGAKSIPMNLFMLYMSGNSIQIFSIMITVMLLWNSLNGVLNTLQVFQPFLPQKLAQGPANSRLLCILNGKLLPPVAIYVFLQCVNFGLGIWKMAGMGLLPTSTSDWLAFMEPKKITEYAFGPI